MSTFIDVFRLQKTNIKMNTSKITKKNNMAAN